MLDLIVKILAALFVFGLVVFVHELGHFVTAKMSGIKVNEFAIGMGPTLFHFGKGETKYALRLFPIGGFVSMEGEDEESNDERSYTRAPLKNRILVIIAGGVMNLILGFVILTVLVSNEHAITSRTVAEFLPNASTQASGLQVGDEIVGVNGRRCFIANDLIYEFLRTQNGIADLEVIRSGQRITLDNVKFDTQPTEDENLKTIVIDFRVLPIEKTPITIVKEAGLWTCSLARMVFLSVMDLITGRVAVNTLAGPVGVVSVISDAVSYGWDSLAMVMALITINLGVFNLLPVPALDGGKLFLLLVEAIRRKPIPEKYEIFINSAGFVLLMGLMAFATFNDIAKLLK
ncbi:M50 family metallopeptidase [Pygmaiobacter massiliensis]|uniref:M50 family metallopeptidase n=1 Tax=Pygmaiobacter massiliensis TaxID=1917873 RepID=UPI002A83127A|nr:M50 family metallopeptidase [Pygmaiobacter massiliensis]